MEPEVLKFLKRIGFSLFLGLVWLIITVVAAIKGDNAFIGDSITLGNVLFYIWFVVSIVALVRVFKRLWTVEIEDDYK